MKVISLFLITIIYSSLECDGLNEKQTEYYRAMAKRMFYHAYDGYMKYAFPFDELRPITCDGHDTWGSYSLTLIDALDTLAIMGNSSEFRKVAQIVLDRANFGSDINVSVFETNIRIVGGLVSAHLMARRMGMELEAGWPCSGPLLRLAETVAKKLLPAFHTKTGMPYGTVNLAHGVPYGETPVTCTAGVGTYLVEFGALSRLTGDLVYEKAALRAMLAAWRQRSSLDLLGNHIDVTTGRWTALDAGIGAGVDSYFEYLVKGGALLQRPELLQIFRSARQAIDQHLRHDDWYLWVTMTRGHVTMPVFQSLEAFWPGVLTLAGDVEAAQKTLFNYYNVWRQYGFTPESYNIPQMEAGSKREGYPLRPELVESLMYLFRATGDRTFLAMGADIITSIEHSTKTACGYATVKNVRNHQLENRMESFFLAETTKYLYLLFAEDHWMHNTGGSGTLWRTARRRCVLDAGGYVFNSEAHPVDPGALACCTPSPAEGDDSSWLALSPHQLADVIMQPGVPITWDSAVEEMLGNVDHQRKQGGAQQQAAQGRPVEEKSGQEVVEEIIAEGDTDVTEIKDREKTKLDGENNDELVKEVVTEENIATESADLELQEQGVGENQEGVVELVQELPEGVVVGGADQNSDMPNRFEEQVDIADVKQNVDDVINELYRKNRYMNSPSSGKKLNLKEKADEQKKSSETVDALQNKFEPTYETDGSKTDDDDGLDKILTSTKTQLSEDTKELEADSNLTAPSKQPSDSKQSTSSGEGVAGDGSVQLNLPRFGAIIAAGENTSDRSSDATSPMENAGISTSVSSSKYSSGPTARVGLAGAKIVRELLLPMLEKTPRSIQPSGPSLREQLERDLLEYSNFTSSASYGRLTCPYTPYATMLSYKGQIIDPTRG